LCLSILWLYLSFIARLLSSTSPHRLLAILFPPICLPFYLFCYDFFTVKRIVFRFACLAYLLCLLFHRSFLVFQTFATLDACLFISSLPESTFFAFLPRICLAPLLDLCTAFLFLQTRPPKLASAFFTSKGTPPLPSDFLLCPPNVQRCFNSFFGFVTLKLFAFFQEQDPHPRLFSQISPED